MQRIHLIINADDLGISERVNDAVFGLMADRRISSSTLMANAPAVRQAVTQLKHFPGCSFGAHLNLTSFEPVKGGRGSTMLVDETGQLSRANETASPSLAHLKACYEEMCAQVESLASLGVPISHFDSHHHVHTRPFLFPVLKAVQKRYRMRRVRIAKNLFTTDQPCAKGLYWRKRAFNSALRNLYRTATTDAFTEFLTFRQVNLSDLQELRSVELMVHPGDSRADTEMSALRSDWMKDHSIPLDLISYTQLTQ